MMFKGNNSNNDNGNVYVGENKFLLSKCGVALFTNTYTDLSYLETDIGRGYYILLSVSPPPRTDESKILDRMNQIAEAIVLSLP